ncbi:MAG: FimV/HubP family polar landmark protein [Pseudomonadota bacterium]
MKPPITIAMLLTLAVSSPLVHALGVGEAKVGSALNAPLDASIPLVDAQQYSPETLSVTLGKRSAYASAGLEWSDVIANVNATLQGQPPTIRLTSSQPVDAPWLDLLLVIESPSGRHAHEVTLLFDPADYEAEGTQASQTASQSLSQPQSQLQSQPQASNRVNTESRAESSRTEASRADVSRNAVNAEANHPAYVNSGDTLWSVAERLKPEQASVQQMMVALLEANPEVFTSGNINAMRAGFRLDVPTDAHVMRRSAAASADAIDAMNAAWRNRDNGLATVALPDLETAANPDEDTPAEQETEASDSPEPGIADAAIVSAEAVSPNAEVVNPSGEAGTLAAQLEQSQAMLAQLVEEREQMRGELDALRSEVSELTEALASQGRVSSSASNDVAQEQETIRDADGESSTEDGGAEERVSSAEDSQGTQIEEAETPASASSAGQTGGFPSLPALMENYRWTLITAGLALLLVLLLMIRRRQAREWEDVDQATISEPSVVPNNHASATPPGGATQESAPTQETSSAQTPKASSFTAVEEELETEDELETDPFSEPSPTIYAAQEDYAKRDASEASEPEDSNPEFDAFEIDEPLEWEADDDEDLGRSQAAGLASQRSATSQGSSETEVASQTEREMEPENEPETETESKTEVLSEPLEPSSSEQDTPSDSRFIDYQPPSLSAEPAAPREETPMQPTVEFEPVEAEEPQGVGKAEEKGKSPADNVADERQKATKTNSDSPLGEGWEIEEVAFKVPGRDNARSS